MKVADLVVGEYYAYRDSKWSTIERVRVVETKVHRITQGGTWHMYASERPDGVLVSAIHPDGAPSSLSGVRRAPKPSKDRPSLLDKLYDEQSNRYRVLPRYLIKTWDDHEAGVVRAEVARNVYLGKQQMQIEAMQVKIGKLPAELQEHFRAVSDTMGVRIVLSRSYEAENLVDVLLSRG